MASVKPRVSIGMPVYGGETHLRASIQSVIDQSFSDWELILLDDCSPDRSLDVIDTFQDERIRLLRNASNEGLVAARNRIMDESRGEFLAWLDQDDLAFPDRIANQVHFLALVGHEPDSLAVGLKAHGAAGLLPRAAEDGLAQASVLNP